MRQRTLASLFGTTVFLSAFLLFSLEPLVATRILPWYGGSAAVWSTCLVFFQTVLLAGYAYAKLLTRLARPKLQPLVHTVALALTLALMPLGPSDRWRPTSPAEPFWHILLLLSSTIAAPYAALSATSPLLQHWLTSTGHQSPYRFFAVSNFASLTALLSYPLVIEPQLDLQLQSHWWSALYIGFIALCLACAWSTRVQTVSTPEIRAEFEWIAPRRKAKWFALAACGGMLLLSFTNHLTENVAAVPLLWVLPLAVYLLTFVAAFSGKRFYSQSIWLRALAIALGLVAYSLADINALWPLQIILPIFLVALFACCLFCHGELYRLRPGSGQLTEFYLIIAAGGAVGSVFIGIIAPAMFDATYELPLTLMLTAALALFAIWTTVNWPIRGFWAALTGAMGVLLIMNWRQYHHDSLALRRSFYGPLRVVQSSHAGPDQTRTLFHGTIEHGAQYLWPPERLRPTTYYGPDSGIGIVLREGFSGPKRVGLVGLGIGTLAAYGRPGDDFRFYEINSQVVDIARSLFFYLRESQARTSVVEGDGRLSLQQDELPLFDVLALDAFSGDAIPVHLLTTQAGELYRQHLKTEGVLAFHVSNDFLDLAPVVQKLAGELGFHCLLVRSHSGDEQILAADWVLLTNNSEILNNEAIKLRSVRINQIPGLRAWTDDYSNLIQIIKTPQVRAR